MNEQTTDTTSTLSPALAAMMAQLSMPHQYAQIMAHSVATVNEQCRLTISRIDK